MRSRKRGNRTKSVDARLNITPMMDIFTIILVFLLKMFSAQGQLVTPAEGLSLPTSTTEKRAIEALSVKVLSNQLIVEDSVVVDKKSYHQILDDGSTILIQPLYDTLMKYSEEAKRTSELYGRTFSGQITIHGDSDIPYNYITKIMYTCGQAGFHDIMLLAYREE